MKYNRVHIESIGYELPPVVVSTAELERGCARLRGARACPRAARTAHRHRRAALVGAGLPALARAPRPPRRRRWPPPTSRPTDIDVLIYAGVCREQFEPATACRVAADLGHQPGRRGLRLSNACLGVLNGMVDIANRIELGQVRAGLVVSCETAREINENVDRADGPKPKSMELFRESLATLTGGSGAVAVLVTDGSSRETGGELLGGVTQTAPQHHALCRWGMSRCCRGHVAYASRRLSAIRPGTVQPTSTSACGTS